MRRVGVDLDAGQLGEQHVGQSRHAARDRRAQRIVVASLGAFGSADIEHATRMNQQALEHMTAATMKRNVQQLLVGRRRRRVVSIRVVVRRLDNAECKKEMCYEKPTTTTRSTKPVPGQRCAKRGNAGQVGKGDDSLQQKTALHIARRRHWQRCKLCRRLDHNGSVVASI